MITCGIYVQRKTGGWLLSEVFSGGSIEDCWYRLRDFSLDNPTLVCKIGVIYRR